MSLKYKYQFQRIIKKRGKVSLGSIVRRAHHQTICLVLTSLILVSLYTSVIVSSVSASPSLTLKWSIWKYVATHPGPVADDLLGDSNLEIVVTGTRKNDSMGIVAAINSTTGAIIWEYEDANISSHNPCETLSVCPTY